jgi:hypothetical protein
MKIMFTSARVKPGIPAGGEFVELRRPDGAATLAATVDPWLALADARTGLDRVAESAVAHEVKSRYRDAVSATFIRDNIMGITVPDGVFDAAGDDLFTGQDDDAKVELSRSVGPALKELSYFGSDSFTIEV